MFWNKIRHVAVCALAIGIASGGASLCVLGSQDAGSKAGQADQKRSTTATGRPDQPEGSKNANGQPAAAESRARLRAQQLATRKARVAREIARLTRELAELALEEYEEVTFARDLAAVGAEITTARADLSRSTDRAEWAERMFKKGYVSRATKATEELTLEKVKFAVEQAQSKRDVLVKYTKGKTIKELRAAVEKARLEELEKLEAWEREQIKETDLESNLRPGAK